MIKKTESGIAAIGIILIVVICLGLVGGVAFFALKRSNSSILPASLTLNDQCDYNDKELCRYLNNAKNYQNYSISSIDIAADGSQTESLVEIDGSSRSHLISKQAGKDIYEYIAIDKTTYTKDFSDGKWYKQTFTDSADDEGDLIDDFEAVSEEETQPAKTSYKAIGKEACGSRQCFKYQVTTQGQEDTTQYIWFDDKEYLLRRARYETKQTTSDLTYSYDKVKINEPAPTKDTPPAVIPNIDPDTLGTVDSNQGVDTVPDLNYTEVPYGDE